MKIRLGQMVVGVLDMHRISTKGKCKKGWTGMDFRIGGKVVRKVCVKTKAGSIPKTEINVGRWLREFSSLPEKKA